MVKLIQLSDDISNYEARRDNPHRVTASQLNVYSKSEISEDELSERLLGLSNVPISQYGGDGWYPVGFNGSFETMTIQEKYIPGVVIRDTLLSATLIVNCTNGFRRGAYLGHVTQTNPTYKVSSVDISTNEYRPNILAVSESIDEVFNSHGRSVVWGKVRTSSYQYDAFIALTNGTGDPHAHTSALFKMPDEFKTNVDKYVIANDTWVYAFIPTSGYPGALVYRVSRVDILTKRVITWVKVTNIKTIGSMETLSGRSEIKFANKWYSRFKVDNDAYAVNRQGNADLMIDLGLNVFQINGEVDDTGVFHLSIIAMGRFTINKVRMNVLLPVKFTFDTTTQVATYPQESKGQLQLQLGFWHSSVPRDDYTSAIYISSDPNNPIGYGHYYQWNTTYYRSNVALWVGTGSDHTHTLLLGHDGYGNPIINRGFSGDALKPETSWLYWSTYEYTILGTQSADQYYITIASPGRIDRQIQLPMWLAVDVLSVKSGKEDSDGTYSVTRAGSPNVNKFDYTFESDRYGELLGFAPTSRVALDKSVKGRHCEYHYYYRNGAHSLTIAGGRLSSEEPVTFESAKYSDSGSITYNGSVTYSGGAWLVLRDDIRSRMSTQYTIAFTDEHFRLEMHADIVHKGYAICFGIAYSSDNIFARNKVYYGVYLINVGSYGSQLTNFSVAQELGYISVDGDEPVLKPALETPSTIHFINESDDIDVVICSSEYGANNLAVTSVYTIYMVKHSTGAFLKFLKVGTYEKQYYKTMPYVVVPGIGLGILDLERGEEADGCVLYWRAIGASRTEIEALTASSTRNVIISQQVPLSWTAQITEDVPLIMLGQSYTLPATKFLLTDIKADPANTVFYVYAEVVDGSATYTVYLQPQEETLSRCYIGEIETNAVKISNLKLSKVTRIGVWRVSESQIGSGIPATSGLPTDVVQLSWAKTQG